MRKETPKHKQQVKRIKAFITRAEKRGYRFDIEFKDQFSSYSTNKLKALKPAKLYALSTAISEETGKIVSGTEQRKHERSISALKARATRLLKREEEKIKQEYREYLEHENSDIAEASITELKARATQLLKNEEEKIKRDYYEYSGYDYSDTADASFTDIVLTNVEARIAEYRDSIIEREAFGARLLEAALNEQIELYGREKVARALEEAPDKAKSESEAVIFASKDEKKYQHLTAFLFLIKGEVISPEEARKIGDALENDSYEVDDSED